MELCHLRVSLDPVKHFLKVSSYVHLVNYCLDFIFDNAFGKGSQSVRHVLSAKSPIYYCKKLNVHLGDDDPTKNRKPVSIRYGCAPPYRQLRVKMLKIGVVYGKLPE